MANLKIGTFNVKGLRNDSKRRKVFQHINQTNFDVICLQETHSEVADEKIWKSQWGGKVIYSHGSRESRGVMILLKKNSPLVIGKVSSDSEGSMIIVNFVYECLNVVLTNLYAPNKDDPQFFINSFEKTQNMMEEAGATSRIIVGDFNLVIDLEKDKRGGARMTHRKAQKVLKAFMDIEGMEEIWRLKNPDGTDMTWKKLNPVPIFERLDYILVSADIVQYVGAEGISPSFMSDHAIPWIILCPEKGKRGRGFWEMNVTLLAEEEFVKTIRNTISDNLKNKGDAVQKWEWIKFKVRECAPYTRPERTKIA